MPATYFDVTNSIYIKIINAKHNLGDYRGIIQDYNKIIELDPENVDAYIKRGKLKYDLGDKEGACLDWSKAGELGSAKAYDLIKEHCN